MQKERATHKSSPKTSQLNNISLSAQRVRLLTALIKRGSITTYEAREQLNIVSPAARIMDLKDAGHEIFTSIEVLYDGAGYRHPHSARYVLLKVAGEVKE